MSLLAPWALAAALALSVPALVVLYMLRLRRSPRAVSSTLLWRKSVEDLLANTPFQRIRWSLLLLLQLLAIALIALALGRPVDSAGGAVRGRVIVLIDQSASMGAVEGLSAGDAPGSSSAGDGSAASGSIGSDPPGDSTGASPAAAAATRTRLDAARLEVESLIDRLGRDDAASQLMLVAFGREPRVLSGFERSRERLRAALGGLVQTDEEADLEAALALADGFARVGAEEEGDVELPVVVIVTDGNTLGPRRSDAFRSSAAEVRFLRVGPVSEAAADPRDNVGIVALSAERSFEAPATVALFVRLANSGLETAETTLVIRADDRVLARRTLRVPADHDGPGEATLLEALELPERALLVVEQTRRDRLAADDVAALVLPAPRAPRIAVVSDGGMDPFLREVLEGAGPEELVEFDPSSWSAVASASGDIDLVIFDRVAAAALPSIPSLTIGAAAPGFTTTPAPPEAGGGRRAIGWSRQHPLMRHVDLDDLVYSGTGGLVLPEGAESLAQGPDGPIMAALERRGVRHAVIAFPLRRSNLPVLPSFPVLMQNALDHLGAGGAGQAGRGARPGEVIMVSVDPEADEIVIVDGRERRTIPRVDPLDPRLALPRFPTAGVRRVEGALAPDDVVAISVLSELESDLAPRELPPLATAPAAASARDQRRELWPFAALLALAVLAIEWIVYLRRAGRV